MPSLGYCYPILLLSFASAARHECKYTLWYYYRLDDGTKEPKVDEFVIDLLFIAYCGGLPELWLLLLFHNHHFFEYDALLKISFSTLQKLLDLERVTATCNP